MAIRGDAAIPLSGGILLAILSEEESNEETTMALTDRRHSKEEFARRGDAIYDSDVRPRLKPEDDGKFVAIAIETGDYEIQADEMSACDRLRARVPGAQVWLVRAGSPYLHRFGARGLRS
jgi:hypothetical protein